MAEKEHLQQYLAGMHNHLALLDGLCDSARRCFSHTQEAFSAASTNAKMHGGALSEVERQRYAALIKEAQDNLSIAAGARDTFKAKLRQLEDRLAGI